jgi:hypothetical protein
MQFTEQAQFNERKAGIERQKAAELRDIANQALAEKNSEFARTQALRRNDIDDKRLGWEEQDRARLTALDERRTRIEDKRLGWEEEDRGTNAELRRMKLAEMEEKNYRDGQEFGMDKEKHALDMDEAKVRLQALREGGGTIRGLTGRGAGGSSGSASGAGGGSFTKGREGFFSVMGRNLGYAPITKDGELLPEGNELMSVMDEYSHEFPDTEEGQEQLFRKAAAKVGLPTKIEAEQADIDERMKSPDKKVAAQAREDDKRLKKMRAQQDKEVAEKKNPTPEPIAEDVKAGGVKLAIKSLSKDTNEEFEYALNNVREMVQTDDLKPNERAEIFDAIMSRGDVKKPPYASIPIDDVYRYLGLKRPILNTGIPERGAMKQLNLTQDQAKKLLVKTSDILYKSKALETLLDSPDLNKPARIQKTLEEALKKAGLSAEEL